MLSLVQVMVPPSGAYNFGTHLTTIKHTQIREINTKTSHCLVYVESAKAKKTYHEGTRDITNAPRLLN